MRDWVHSVPLDEVALVAILRVIDAWENAGINPKYHQQMKDNMAVEWPTLFATLSELTEIVDKEAARKRIAELAGQFLDD